MTPQQPTRPQPASIFGLGRLVRYSDYAKALNMVRERTQDMVGIVVGRSCGALPVIAWEQGNSRHTVHPAFLEWADDYELSHAGCRQNAASEERSCDVCCNLCSVKFCIKEVVELRNCVET